MFCDIIKISENLLCVEGMIPRSILTDPDIANSVIYKSGDTVFLIDTGVTIKMRKTILEAVESLKPFRRFVLLNSHGHSDHTCNNVIVNMVEAEEKRHLISRPGIDMMDFEKYFIGQYESLNRYISYLDCPRFPLSVFAKGMKLLGWLNSKYKYLMVKKSLDKFKPFDTSVETADVFEDSPVQKLSGAMAGWSGWNLYDVVFALESRGHSPDHLVFYIPEEKVLILADESFQFFNCWPESSSLNIQQTLKKGIAMARKGDVSTLITGHDHEVFTGERIISHLQTILSDYEYFRESVIEIVAEYPSGITINKIYKTLRLRKAHPVLKKYFALEFPKMPPMLKLVIASLLLEHGADVSGPFGQARFSIKSKECE